MLEFFVVNLEKLWPHYFGLTNDISYLKVRARHFPLEDSPSLSDESTVLLTRSEAKWLGLKLRFFLPFISYEASAFLQPAFYKQESILKNWATHLSEKKNWDMCTLSRLKIEQAHLLKKMFGIYCTRPLTQKIHALRLNNSAQPDFNSFLKARGFRFRKNFRHSQNAIAKAGFYFSTLNSPSELFQLFEKRHRIKDTGDYSVTPVFQNYLSELWQTMASENRIFSVALRNDEKVIAGVMAFSFGEDLHIYQIAYDPEFKNLNPGRNALLRLIEEQWGKKFRLIDFMSEWEYVGHITDDYFEYSRVQIFAKTLVGRLLALKTFFR